MGERPGKGVLHASNRYIARLPAGALRNQRHGDDLFTDSQGIESEQGNTALAFAYGTCSRDC